MLCLCRGVVRLKVSSNAYEQAEAIKASMPRTTYFEGWTVDTLQQELPIWVLSLARAKDRRETMIKQLTAAGAQMQQGTIY
jgi:hypothetical protein